MEGKKFYPIKSDYDLYRSLIDTAQIPPEEKDLLDEHLENFFSKKVTYLNKAVTDLLLDARGERAKKLQEKRRESNRAITALHSLLTEQDKNLLIETYAETGNITKAIKRVQAFLPDSSQKITRAKINLMREIDPDFDDRWIEAEESFKDLLEEEAVRRAVEGVEKGVYFKGECVDTERVHSDRLLELLLKANRPEKFKDSKMELTGAGGKPLEIAITRFGEDDVE